MDYSFRAMVIVAVWHYFGKTTLDVQSYACDHIDAWIDDGSGWLVAPYGVLWQPENGKKIGVLGQIEVLKEFFFSPMVGDWGFQ